MRAWYYLTVVLSTIYLLNANNVITYIISQLRSSLVLEAYKLCVRVLSGLICETCYDILELWNGGMLYGCKCVSRSEWYMQLTASNNRKKRAAEIGGEPGGNFPRFPRRSVVLLQLSCRNAFSFTHGIVSVNENSIRVMDDPDFFRNVSEFTKDSWHYPKGHI